jgi:hypothetical protein
VGAAISLAAIVVAAAFSAALWLISARYAPRFAGRKRVVMNWSFSGKPNSYASPRTALAVTPAVGTATLIVVGGLVAFATPHDERLLALPMIAFTGAVLSAIHAGHMWFAARADVAE